jgi:hypothetical protein
MQDGTHTNIPNDRVATERDLLLLQAEADGVGIDIEEIPGQGDMTTLTWRVKETAAAAANGRDAAPAAAAPPAPQGAIGVVAGAAGGGAIGAAVGGPLGAAVGAAAGAVAGALLGTGTAEKLGELSRKFEVGKRGCETISTGIGDAGGASYGLYQMTSVQGGTVGAFVTEASFPFRARFAGLTPGTPAFNDAWRNLAAEEPAAFASTQHDYIRRTHYDPVVKGVLKTTGLDVEARSAALRDAVWSTAVQHGPKNDIVRRCAASLLGTGMLKDSGDKAFDRALIEAIYAERGRKDENGVLVHFSRNSRQVQAGVAARFPRECKDALAMLG